MLAFRPVDMSAAVCRQTVGFVVLLGRIAHIPILTVSLANNVL